MFQQSEIFEKNYREYCNQISQIELMSVKDRLGLKEDGDRMVVPFFNEEYRVSGDGIFDPSGTRPDYGICVIIAKYILLCPDRDYQNEEWVSFKDFKSVSHFTNVNFFASDVERAIEKKFAGRLQDLFRAGEKSGGIAHAVGTRYDLSMVFRALPNISLLLLFNDSDEEFPARCTVLFQKHAEKYLDPESLAMLGAALAWRLKKRSIDHENK